MGGWGVRELEKKTERGVIYFKHDSKLTGHVTHMGGRYGSVCWVFSQVYLAAGKMGEGTDRANYLFTDQ